MPDRIVKLAMIQMRVEPGAKHENLRRAARLVAEAAQAGAQVALLPEALTTGWTDDRGSLQADAIPDGETCAALRQMASRHHIFVCAGLVERAPDQRLYNTRAPYGKLWLDNYAPIARDFRLWIAGASNVGPIATGPWAGRKCIGCSLLVGPDGQPALQGPYGEHAETILHADLQLEPRPARGEGWERKWLNEPAQTLGQESRE